MAPSTDVNDNDSLYAAVRANGFAKVAYLGGVTEYTPEQFEILWEGDRFSRVRNKTTKRKDRE